VIRLPVLVRELMHSKEFGLLDRLEMSEVTVHYQWLVLETVFDPVSLESNRSVPEFSVLMIFQFQRRLTGLDQIVVGVYSETFVLIL
jgi:hypothetical protein